MGEQRNFGFDARRVAAHRAVRADHAVARAHDQQRVGADRGPQGPYLASRHPENVGESPVGGRGAVGDRLQGLPDALLEVRTASAALQLEAGELTVEVGAEPADDLGEGGRAAPPVRLYGDARCRGREMAVRAVPPVAVADSSPTSSSSPRGL